MTVTCYEAKAWKALAAVVEELKPCGKAANIQYLHTRELFAGRKIACNERVFGWVRPYQHSINRRPPTRRAEDQAEKTGIIGTGHGMVFAEAKVNGRIAAYSWRITSGWSMRK